MKIQTIFYTLYALLFIISAYKTYKIQKRIKHFQNQLKKHEQKAKNLIKKLTE